MLTVHKTYLNLITESLDFNGGEKSLYDIVTIIYFRDQQEYTLTDYLCDYSRIFGAIEMLYYTGIISHERFALWNACIESCKKNLNTGKIGGEFKCLKT